MFQFFLLLLTFFLASTLAIIPVQPDRYITNDSYLVSNIQKSLSPSSSSLSTSKGLQDSTTLGSFTEKSVNSTAIGNSTVLNLIPGISLLQTDQYNECYFVNTTIGQTEYPLIIDTGSAYLWVYGEDCVEDLCQDEKLYTPTESISATSTFALAYVTGSAVGEVVEDNIIVNKLATTQKFKFGMAQIVPQFFDRYPVSGIFGLPSNDSSSIESIISALQQSHAIDHKRFSISMGQVNPNDNTYPNDGIFAIGDPLRELYLGDIHYVSVVENQDNHWLIVMDEIFVGNDAVRFTQGTLIGSVNSTIKRNAIVDSGTTVLAVPKQDALDVHAFFPNSVTDGTNFAIYCNSTLELNFQLNNINFTLGPSDYLGTKYAANSGYNGYCVSNIQGITADSWILGAVFLKTVYADFDIDQQQVGFAKRNSAVVLTSTTTSAQSTAIATGSNSSSGSGKAPKTSTQVSAAKGFAGTVSVDQKVCFLSIFTSLSALLLL